jgi:hypothetical protein
MVIRDPSEEVKKAYEVSEEDKDEKIFVFESDSETEQRSQKEGGGVQLISLKKWWKVTAEYYETNELVLVWRKIDNFELSEEIEKDLEKFLLGNAGKRYKFKISELVLSTVGKNKTEKTDTTFCSELVADTLKCLKLIGEDVLSNNYVPRDFTSMFRKDQKDFKLNGDAKFETEMRIKF